MLFFLDVNFVNNFHYYAEYFNAKYKISPHLHDSSTIDLPSVRRNGGGVFTRWRSG
jgi:hypothetical protein